MADTTISDLAEDTSPAAGDLLVTVDISAGTNKKVQAGNLPLSSATTSALAGKAPLASPALTGTPTAPTATPGTDTTQVATTAFVTAAVSAGGGGGGATIAPTSSVLKGDGAGNGVAATAGTDYLTPTGNGGSLTGLTRSQVGLGSVDNTSDAGKPISTATQAALDLKAAKSANLSDLANAGTARTNLGLGTAATHAHADYATADQGLLADSATQPADLESGLATRAPTSPAISLAELAARRPGLLPAADFGVTRAAPAPYVRYSAQDSVQYSNLVGGGGGGVALTLGQRLVQVNDTISGGTRYTYATRLGGTAGGPTLVERDGRRYWDFRGAEKIESQGAWAALDECTIAALCRPRRHDLDGLFDLGPSSLLAATGGRINWFNQQPTADLLAGNPGADVAVVVRVRSDPQRRLEVFLDGVRVIDESDPSADVLGATGVAIGAVGGAALFDGLVAEWMAFDEPLPDHHVAWVSQALRARGTAPDVEAAPLGVNLLVEANSISDPLAGLAAGNQTGYGPPFPPTQMWPSILAARHPSWVVTNLAVASRWTAPIGGDTNGGNVVSPTFAAHLAAYHDPGMTNVVVIWELINHLVNLISTGDPTPGVTAAQAVLALGTAAVSAGWKVVIGTGSNRADGGADATYQAQYLVANAYLRANGSGTAWHALADLGGDARFQDPDNALYILSSDKVHFTLLGQAVAASEFFGPAIEDAIDA